MKRVTVKVCGITRCEDARRAIALGADLLGFNFWPRSPRYIDPQSARNVIDEVKGKAIIVGVWVDPEPHEIESAFDDLGVELAQLHGDEDPQEMEPFMNRILKAFGVESKLDPRMIEPWQDAWGHLFDCAPSGLYGGGGRAWPYERVAGLETRRPAFLAGGIEASNLAEALRRSGFSMVDVCSSVESSPGIKDSELLTSFFREVENVQSQDSA